VNLGGIVERCNPKMQYPRFMQVIVSIHDQDPDNAGVPTVRGAASSDG
jgi:hypothetical protein